MTNSIIADPSLSPSGQRKIEWARRHMPIINQLVQKYLPMQPLSDVSIVTSIHLEAKTACLVQALSRLGAEVYATGCNPLSTQDDVAAALAETPRVMVYAKHDYHDEYWDYLKEALSHHPDAIIDDGGDLVKLLHGECRGYADYVLGGCEETTTGIHRLRALDHADELLFPMINVNGAECKHNYDNHYGTGQSALDGILRTTNLIIAGKTVVVAGYGDCGSGIAKNLKGIGANVIVTEINPIKALKAHMDGYRVMPMNDAAKLGDLFITATGCKNVITEQHFNVMKDGVILANAGHFDVEIDIKTLDKQAVKKIPARKNIVGYEMFGGKTIYLLAQGRLVNLAAADGHAAEIMDMSFAIQLLSVIYVTKSEVLKRLKPTLYNVPEKIDKIVAELALRSSRIRIDKLTDEQQAYLENGF